jgi:serine/threonine protein phosphatase PrpC
MLCSSSARTHVGTVRRRNEDAVLARPDIGLFAVADGAGGHQRGDYASRSIIDALSEVTPPSSGCRFVKDVSAVLRTLNWQFRQQAVSIDPNAVIGSTVVVLMIVQNQSFCLWAGDSRFYRLRAGELYQLSRDQSYVQDLIERGEIEPDAAATHPLANVVTNLVGGADELILEERHDGLKAGDILLLCSDGLNRAVADHDIAAILRNNPVTAAADRLIERALACGARDNVSVVVIEYAGP